MIIPRLMVTLATLAAGFFLSGCSPIAFGKRASTPPPAPKPQPAAAKPAPAVTQAKVEGPYSSPQTNVVLPAPQPVNPEALSAGPPHPPIEVEPAKPRTAPPPAVAKAEAPVAVVTPAPAQPRQRIRMAESGIDRRRVVRDVHSRRRETEQILGKLSQRQLNDQEKQTVERIRSFLEQAMAALNRNEIQEADALSNRAVLLSRDLARE